VSRRYKSRVTILAFHLVLCSLVLSGTLVAASANGASASTGLSIRLRWQKVIQDQNVNGQSGNVTESSPVLATLGPNEEAAVFGDSGGYVYAFNLRNGKEIPGWPVDIGEPVQSSPSATVLPGDTYDTIFVGGGSDGAPVQPYGAFAITNTGGILWRATLTDPEPAPDKDHGVTAGLTVVGPSSDPELIAGTTGQTMYGLNAITGAVNWKFFTADSVHSTAAVAHLDGSSRTQVIEGGDSTYDSVPLYGSYYANGGHVRIMTPHGRLACQVLPQPDQTIDSSPVVADLTRGTPSIITGTGYFYSPVKDSDSVISVNPDCAINWTTRLNGETEANPAIGDFEGLPNKLDIAEAASPTATSDGVIYVLNSKGKILPGWPRVATGSIEGWEGIATADLSGSGYQDLIVPTNGGADIFAGRTGRLLDVLGSNTGYQNSPLITTDPDGRVGVTLAGYQVTWTGCPSTAPCLWSVVDHYQVMGHRATVGPADQSWPEFHHDPHLTGNINDS
jgi:hypothetical protein